MKPADVYYQSLLKRAQGRWDVEAALSGETAWETWRDGMRAALIKVLGGWPAAVDLAIERGEKVACEGYTRERFTFVSEEGLRTPAYLLIPDGAGEQTPVAVALHGHGWGARAIVGLDANDQSIGDDDEYQKNFALRLVRRGFVVVAPELLGFGDLRMERDDVPGNPSAISCHNLSTLLLAVGRTMAGVRVWQASRSLDAVRLMGYVGDAVAMGISGGGLVCAYLAALDDCIRACCVSGFANTYRDSIFAVHHCVDNYQPGMLLSFEESDVLCGIAPKPMIWEAGDIDDIFPIEAVRKAQAVVGRAYAKLGAPEAFAVDVFSGGHQIHGTAAIDFLERVARG